MIVVYEAETITIVSDVSEIYVSPLFISNEFQHILNLIKASLRSVYAPKKGKYKGSFRMWKRACVTSSLSISTLAGRPPWSSPTVAGRKRTRKKGVWSPPPHPYTVWWLLKCQQEIIMAIKAIVQGHQCTSREKALRFAM